MKPFRRRWIAIAMLGLALDLAAAAQKPQAPAAPPAAAPQPPAAPCPYPQTFPDMPGVCHPYPQPFPKKSNQTTTGCPGKDCKTVIVTGEGIFPRMNPFNYKTFPGNNFLPSVYTDVFDSLGREILNTLPSTPTAPYNLHDGDPQVSPINPKSPEDDLTAIYYEVMCHLPRDLTEDSKEAIEQRCEGKQRKQDDKAVRAALQRALDIIEGNPVPDRAYSGFPLLHFDSLEKVRKAVPIKNEKGEIIGGNVDVHQIWYNQRIESDTAYVDLSPLKPPNVPQGVNPTWTITYTVDVLSRGRDDFSPFAMYMDPQKPTPSMPNPPAMPGIGMDQSFFDMEDGTRTVFKIKMAPVSYFSLVYTWGWRMHPPRAQVMEYASKQICYTGPPPCPPTTPPPQPPPQSAGCPAEYQSLTLPQLEQAVFCQNPNCTSARCGAGEPRFTADGQPTPCEQQKLYAISKIGDLAPEKRMWNAVRDAQKAADQSNWKEVRSLMIDEGLPAFLDWRNRNLLPKKVKDWVVKNVPDYKHSDVMLLYVNNSTYGELTNGAWGRWDPWEHRPKKLRVLVLNGDHFVHSYTIADFGGNRGWENQFRSTVKVAGSGCWFTFGRNWTWLPVGGPVNPYICVAETGGSDGLTPSAHWIDVELNYDPSRRLRFYQFDPFHHDVAIYSVH